MKVGEAIWINDRWIGLCMEKWWWELLWSGGEGGVGWRGEGGNTHSNESITEVNYNLRSIFCYLDVTFLSN